MFRVTPFKIVIVLLAMMTAVAVTTLYTKATDQLEVLSWIKTKTDALALNRWRSSNGEATGSLSNKGNMPRLQVESHTVSPKFHLDLSKTSTPVSLSSTLLPDKPQEEKRQVELPRVVSDCVANTTYRNVSLNVNDTILLNKIPIQYKQEDETSEQRKDSFQHIFSSRIWGGVKQTIQSSGPGSTWGATNDIREILDHVISYIKKQTGKSRITLLDAPCGDMMWMSRFLANRSDVEYTGVDIVPDLINSHKVTYANQTKWRFIKQDVVKTTINKSYDLIHTRHMTQHLTTSDTLRVLKHFSDSGSLFLLATTYPDKTANTDLVGEGRKSYRFRTQNLQTPPFSLHPPVCMRSEKSSSVNRCFSALWKLPLAQVTSCRHNNNVKITKHPRENWKIYHCG
jgi:hypothetical protein